MDQLKGPVTGYNQQQSPFLSLPGEIRNIIYKYALGGETIQVECRGGREGWSEDCFYRVEEAALRHTCQQTRSEISQYLTYSVNTFSGCTQCLFSPVNLAFQPGLQYISSIEIQYMDFILRKHNFRVLKVLKRLRSLNHFVVVLPMALRNEVKKAISDGFRKDLEKDRHVGQTVKITLKDASGEN